MLLLTDTEYFARIKTRGLKALNNHHMVKNADCKRVILSFKNVRQELAHEFA
jgi:hypothetical protein